MILLLQGKRKLSSRHRHSLLLRRHARATRALPTSLKEVLSTAVKFINFVSSRSVNHRILRHFVEKWEQNMKCFAAFQGDKSWSAYSNKGRSFTPYERKRNPTLGKNLKERILFHGLTYLADVFNHMNEINISVQDSEVTFREATEKLQAFLAKLSIWKKRVDADILASFRFSVEKW